MLYTAGSNAAGQLGTGTFDDQASPVLITPTTAICGCVQLAGGANHSVLLDSQGIVFVAGDNTYGQLGLCTNPPTSGVQVFVHAAIDTSIDDPVVHIACGWNTTFAVTRSGIVWVAGSNSHGQAGLAQSAKQTHLGSTSGFVCISIVCPQLPPISQIAYASDPDHVSIKSLVFHPQRIHGLGGIVRSMACGQHHSIAIVTAPQDGKPLDESTLLVKTFGRNRYGQLGISPQLGSLRNTSAASTTDSLSLLDPSWTPHTVLYGDRPESHSSIRTTLSSETPLSVRTVASGSEHTVVAAVLQLDEGSPKVQCLSWGWNEHGINRPQHHLHRTAQPPIPSIGHNVTRWIQRSPDDYIKHVQDSTKFPKAGAAKQGKSYKRPSSTPTH
ncbi:hypothetical protein BASA60_000517 [Batrachochytrium salamandrivorans]|nr:hypothetical protein BASA60_000517 [Batrachochytrium salamandrivorans]